MKNQKTSKNSKIATSAGTASSVLAAALISVSSTTSAASYERCADIVKGGANACAVKSLGLSCHASATEDNMKGAWIEVPTGTCANIISLCAGDAEAPEGTDSDKLAAACGKLAEQSDSEIVGGRLVDGFGEPI